MLKRLVIFGTLFVLVSAVVFIVNQTAQVVSLANTVNPALGRLVLGTLLAIYAFVVIAPLILFLRLPKPLSPPADEASPEYQAYLRRLGARLARNRQLAGSGPLEDRAAIETALRTLDSQADEVIRKTASALFVSTAISQNGRLDALMVLIEQTRLIWRVARIYNQRPTPRDFGRLYANVGATLFAASALEDLDIREQVEPVVKAAVGGAMAGLVPGVATVASLILNSVMDGTANAYLTLRVGIICQSYCRGVVALDRRQTRRRASLAAAAMLGSIVSASAGAVIRSMAAAGSQAGVSTLESAFSGLRGAGARLNPFKPPTGA